MVIFPLGRRRMQQPPELVRRCFSPRFFEVLCWTYLHEKHHDKITFSDKRYKQLLLHVREMEAKFVVWLQGCLLTNNTFGDYIISVRAVTKCLGLLMCDAIELGRLDDLRQILSSTFHPSADDLQTMLLQTVLQKDIVPDWINDQVQEACARGYTTNLNWFRLLVPLINRRGQLYTVLADPEVIKNDDETAIWSTSIATFGKKIAALHKHSHGLLKHGTILELEQPPLPLKRTQRQAMLNLPAVQLSPSSGKRRRIIADTTQEDDHVQQAVVHATFFDKDSGAVLAVPTALGTTANFFISLPHHQACQSGFEYLQDAAAIALSGVLGDVIPFTDIIKQVRSAGTYKFQCGKDEVFFVPVNDSIKDVVDMIRSSCYTHLCPLWIGVNTAQSMILHQAGTLFAVPPDVLGQTPGNFQECRLTRKTQDSLQIYLGVWALLSLF
jgi:hypothetical protein